MTCQYCDHGLIHVTHEEALAATGLPAGAEVPAELWTAYRAHLNAVRPCRYCRQPSYDRWANGCWQTDHRPCDVCREDP